MKLIYKLSEKEAYAIDLISHMYGLEAMADLADPGFAGSDKIAVSGHYYSLSDGVDYLLEAIDADSRELFKSEISETTQWIFLNLARQLGRTVETKWNGKLFDAPLLPIIN